MSTEKIAAQFDNDVDDNDASPIRSHSPESFFCISFAFFSIVPWSIAIANSFISTLHAAFLFSNKIYVFLIFIAIINVSVGVVDAGVYTQRGKAWAWVHCEYKMYKKKTGRNYDIFCAERITGWHSILVLVLLTSCSGLIWDESYFFLSALQKCGVRICIAEMNGGKSYSWSIKLQLHLRWIKKTGGGNGILYFIKFGFCSKFRFVVRCSILFFILGCCRVSHFYDLKLEKMESIWPR